MDFGAGRPFRLGRIDYINTLPIYWGFDVEEFAGEVEVVAATPARLNRMLQAGELDMSAVSAAEYAQNFSDYLLLPGLSIACRGAVRSVLWYGRKPFESFDGVPFLLTDASLTSAWLSRILFSKLFHASPEFFEASLDSRDMSDPRLQGFLAIGDQCLLSPELARGFPFRLDLGEAWERLTGRPFVFGVWAVRRDSLAFRGGLAERVARSLCESRHRGCACMERIARETASTRGISCEDCLAYLSNIHYDLAPPYVEGMRLFFECLREFGLIRNPVEPEFWAPGEGGGRCWR